MWKEEDQAHGSGDVVLEKGTQESGVEGYGVRGGGNTKERMGSGRASDILHHYGIEVFGVFTPPGLTV